MHPVLSTYICASYAKKAIARCNLSCRGVLQAAAMEEKSNTELFAVTAQRASLLLHMSSTNHAPRIEIIVLHNIKTYHNHQHAARHQKYMVSECQPSFMSPCASVNSSLLQGEKLRSLHFLDSFCLHPVASSHQYENRCSGK